MADNAQAHFAMYRDHSDLWRWSFRVGQTPPLAVSNGAFAQEGDCVASIRSMVECYNAPIIRFTMIGETVI
jgi:hypothetical protein